MVVIKGQESIASRRAGEARGRKKKRQIRTYKFPTKYVLSHLSIHYKMFRNPSCKNHFSQMGRAIFIFLEEVL